MAKQNKPKEVYTFHTRTGEYTGPLEIKAGDELPENATEQTPPYCDGDQVQVWNGEKWEVVKREIFELAEFTRAKRNSQLSGSDWSQLEDSKVDKKAWAEYRQELRDLSKQKGFPKEIVWPVTPSSKPAVIAEKK